MMVSELLWVGKGPGDGVPEKRCATAQEAYASIKNNVAAVVPTTDIAYRVLRLLGNTHEWSIYRTGKAHGAYDFDDILLM